MTDSLSHWDKVYTTKKHDQVSWHQDHPTISLDWIMQYTRQNDAIIDVGCGVSLLADNLLGKGYSDLSLLELSKNAIEAIQKRLAPDKDKVSFYNQNILKFSSKKQFKLWHDRAVFHFLTNPDDQQTYIQKLDDYLQKDGFFLLATFSPDGPTQCSELEVVQYDEKKITQLLGQSFKLIKTTTESHPHPNGGTQEFNYFLLQKQ
ncbi:methyltransferase domain-containing protein [Candidatus Thioglobus sp.]|nr:class I SAM-dependent methyltransferase [Candidatus Thioglobus sp.]MDC1104928.1 methyltransferase domain-containing protein [Candidatus Thioglobus sp.]